VTLRIALVLHGWPPETQGGTGLYVAALGDALTRAGHAVAFVAPGRRPGLRVGRRGAARVVRIGAPTWRWSHGHRRRITEALWSLWLRRWRPDVVHVHHLSGLSLGLPALARPAAVVLTLHDYALPCARGQRVDRRMRICPGPTPARCASCVLPSSAARQVRRVSRRLSAARVALAAAHRVLSPSRHLADWFHAWTGRQVQRTELPLVRPIPPAPRAPAGPVRFLFLGSVIPTKGPHVLLDAFGALRAGTAALTIAGPSPGFDAWPGFAAQVARVAERTPGARLRGAVPAAQVPDLLAAHDVLVLPSLWPENSPLVVREATAAGLRVVVGSVGGAAELAPSALQIPPGDRTALSAALQTEAARGRGRRPPARWPTPDEHAERLLREVYQPLVGAAARGGDREGPRWAKPPRGGSDVGPHTSHHDAHPRDGTG